MSTKLSGIGEADPISFPSGGASTPQFNRSGQIKVNDGNSIQPFLSFSGSNPPAQQVTYTFPLGFSASPTTTWPSNDTVQDSSSFYDIANDTFLENAVLGQVHRWRIILFFSKPGGSQVNINVTISNPVPPSTFSTSTVFISPTDTGFPPPFTGTVVGQLTTIADQLSLPAPLGTGNGYELHIQPNSTIDITVLSVTRISESIENVTS